jgi:xylose isomerase
MKQKSKQPATAKQAKMPAPRFGFGAWAFMSGLGDRFGSGYNPFPLSLEEVFEMTSKIDGMEYICGHLPMDFPDEPHRLIELARTSGVGIGSVVTKTFGAEYRNGGFTNPDPVIRKKAIANVIRAMQLNNIIRPTMAKMGKTIGCTHTVLWQGSDGSNGLFLTDYSERWRRMIDGYIEVLEAVPNCNLCLEPKSGDPAEDMLVRETVHGVFIAKLVNDRLPKALQGRIVQNIEYGHAHIAGGKLAENICLALDFGILAQIDLNDNRKHWDNDHIPGNDNFNEILEAEYWLYHKGFSGLWNFDIFPQRVSGATKKETIRRFAEHLVECINATRYRLEIVKRLPPPEEMQQYFSDPDETKTSRLLRSVMNRKMDFEESKYRGK